MARENTWRDRFLMRLAALCEQRGWKLVWYVLNVANQRGVPDTFVHVHRGGSNRGCGLFEFKKGRGTTTPAQKVRLNGLDKAGVVCGVIRLLNVDEGSFEIVDECDSRYVMLPVFDRPVTWNKLAEYVLGLM